MSMKFRSCVLLEENLAKRKLILKHLIAVAAALLELNNFNGVLEIVSAIQSSCIYRLKNTFAGLSKYALSTSSPPSHSSLTFAIRNEVMEFEVLKELVDRKDNYKNFRTKLKSANPPMIPYDLPFASSLEFCHE